MSTANQAAGSRNTRVASVNLVNNSIGVKAVVAISGVVLFGFTIGHMLGNLQVFLGPEAINTYATNLHNNAPLLWGTRVVLLLAVVSHVWGTLKLIARNRAARPVAYAKVNSAASTYASRTMRFTGPLLFFFIVYHLLHLTLGKVTPFRDLDPYYNLVTSFQNPLLAGTYVIAMCLLGFHLYHGAWSFMQSLGLEHPRYNKQKALGAMALSGLVVFGNISIPVAILAGFIR